MASYRAGWRPSSRSSTPRRSSSSTTSRSSGGCGSLSCSRKSARMTENGQRSARGQVLPGLRNAEKFILPTHENPDGDALGSLLGMNDILLALGKDSHKFMDPREFPLPPEYRFLPLDDVLTSPPEDLHERTVVFLDCGNLERNPAEAFRQEGMHLVNIDHHHDNTRFGTVNLVDPQASCTAEIVWDLMGGLGVTPTHEIAVALYVGLITDTGRFMYENTSARSHLMAGDLIEAGVEPQEVYRQVYEGVP